MKKIIESNKKINLIYPAVFAHPILKCGIM